jgi:hypothetical protein
MTVQLIHSGLKGYSGSRFFYALISRNSELNLVSTRGLLPITTMSSIIGPPHPIS